MELGGVKVNGAELAPAQYTRDPKSLTISADALPTDSEFDLEIVTLLKPQDNSLLEGLYKSGGNYCTQVRRRLLRVGEAARGPSGGANLDTSANLTSSHTSSLQCELCS